MAISGDVRIKVDAADLKAKASDVRTRISEMQHTFDEVMEKVRHTDYYWIGEAGNLHRQNFFDQREDIEYILKRLSEHPTDLEIIAGVYEGAEKTNIATGQAISNNLIS